MLLNCGHEIYNAGTLLIHHNEVPKSVFLILTGTVEFIASEDSAPVSFRADRWSVIWRAYRVESFRNLPCPESGRRLNHSSIIVSGIHLCNQLEEEIKHILDIMEYFQQSWLFENQFPPRSKPGLLVKRNCWNVKKET